MDDLVGVLHPDQGETEEAARHGADDAYEHARHEKNPPCFRARSHGLQDADLFRFLGHEEDEMADDGETGHEDDDGDDHEERELLQ